MLTLSQSARPRESGDPGPKTSAPELMHWIPAYAGMSGEWIADGRRDDG